jgi:NADPH:quinone reductase-like Zn-dependent oxidoreductase
VPANVLAELPDEVSFDDAATLPIAAVTAWQGLRLAGPLLGKRVCITGAAGGVGRFAIQLASLGGADVTAVARSAERSSGLAALGAREVVEALEPEGDAFDVILDSVGGAVLAAAIGRIAPGGDIVSVGNSSGEETTFDVRTLFRRAHGARLHGYLSHTALAEDHSGARDLRALADLVAAGRLRTEVSMAVDWHEADAAITALLQRRVNGKAVLRIASGA